MDPRVRRHAEILLDHCTNVEPGDDVVVRGPLLAEDLLTAIAERLGEIGATATFSTRDDRLRRAYLRAADEHGTDIRTSGPKRALVEEADVLVVIKGHRNVSALSDVPPETMAAHVQAQQPLKRAQMDTRWVGTQYPAPGEAQRAGMSTEEYEEFVYDAVDTDWAAQHEYQSQLVDVLDPADELRIVSGDATDLRMRIDDRTARNDAGGVNLPGGEVFTAPVADSVEGEVLFDKPVLHNGHVIEDAFLRVEDGEVVDHAASENEAVLTEVIETDEGARRVGELGIGMNRDIDRFTYNVLFDEKIGDTVHLALGSAYDECLPEGETGNQSAVHVDMIVDVADESFIEVDGEVIQRDGTFRFEDGFEG